MSATRKSAGAERRANGEPLADRMTILGLLEYVPNGIAGVREVILDLAIRGLLVPQSASDGTADDLRARLARAHRSDARRAGRRCSPVADDEVPFKVPPGWCWMRLSDLGEFMGGGTPSKSNPAFWSGAIPWVSPKDMKRPYIEDAEDHISEAALGASAAKLIPAPSALFVLRGMILAHSFPVAITRREVAINQDMRALVLSVPAVAPFLLRVLQASRRRVLANVERSSHGTCRLDSGVVENLLVALPPLAEQKRIVAKVDQLMALCDELEARQSRRRDVGGRLTEAALGALASAETGAGLAEAWKRVQSEFGRLVDGRDAVDALRRSILDLCLRGRLTSQDPRDGNAAEHLQHLAKERAKLGVRSKVGAPVPEAVPFSIPKSWSWARLEQLWQSISDGDHQAPPKAPSGVPFLTIGNISRGAIDFSETRFVGRDYYEGLDAARVPREGDLLYSVVGSFGIPVVVSTGREFCVQRHIAILRPLASTNVQWMNYWMRSGFVYGQAAATATGIAQPTVGLGSLRSFLVPVPPAGEQGRIVRTLDALMRLCDDLEMKLRARDDGAERLAKALVARLTE